MQLHVPAWTGSVIVHTIVFLILFLIVRPDAEIRGAPGTERIWQMGIALDSDSDHSPVVQMETVISELQSANETSGGSEGTSKSPTETPEQAETNADETENVIGPAAATGDNSDTDNQPTTKMGTGGEGTGTGTGKGSGSGDGATVNVFGLEGTGHRFAFVFDRSDTMSEHEGRPIQAAKAELIKAINSLGSVHQFIIVFYNQDTLVYPEGERAARSIYATDENKESASRFVQSIVPAGGTNHEEAISIAAKQKPDVIFLLTDGEAKDDLSNPQLDRITKATSGIQINVIQFGIGPEPRIRNYLKLLAIQNAGLYQYIDVGKL